MGQFHSGGGCSEGCHAFFVGGKVTTSKRLARMERRMTRPGRLHGCVVPAKHGRTEVNQKPRSTQKEDNQLWSGNVRVGTIVRPACCTFAEQYELLADKIGSGMSGDVFLAVPRRHCFGGSPVRVAVKTLAKQAASKSALASALQEADIYLRMDHANIARLLRVYNEPDNLYIVMEYCSGGSLADRLLKHGHMSENEAIRTTRQMLAAVNYCHKHSRGKVCHRDLKHTNFVYANNDADAPLKLLDFGLSRVLSDKRPWMNSCAGTVYYLAPEVIRRNAYNEACDMWSLGVIVFSLLTGTTPFEGTETDQVKKAILSNEVTMEGPEWHGISDLATEFVSKLLRKEPADRPTAEEALHHPWLSSTSRRCASDQTDARASPEILKLLVGFADQNPLFRAGAASLVYTSGAHLEEDVRFLEAQFQVLDTNKDGIISASELSAAMHQTLGTTPEDAKETFKNLDLDGDACIQYTEFLTAAVGTKILSQENAVEEVFDNFDLDGNGTLQVNEFIAMLGGQFCGKSTAKIFADLDLNGDQNVDLHTFSAKLLHSKSSDAEDAPKMVVADVQPRIRKRLYTTGCTGDWCRSNDVQPRISKASSAVPWLHAWGGVNCRGDWCRKENFPTYIAI